jgi:hypothetical protein
VHGLRAIFVTCAGTNLYKRPLFLTHGCMVWESVYEPFFWSQRPLTPFGRSDNFWSNPHAASSHPHAESSHESSHVPPSRDSSCKSSRGIHTEGERRTTPFVTPWTFFLVRDTWIFFILLLPYFLTIFGVGQKKWVMCDVFETFLLCGDPSVDPSHGIIALLAGNLQREEKVEWMVRMAIEARQPEQLYDH